MTDPPHPHFPKRRIERQIFHINVPKCLVPRISLFPYKRNIPCLHSFSVVNRLSFPHSSTILCYKESVLKSLEKVVLNLSRRDFLHTVIPVAVCESQNSNSFHTNEKGHDFSLAENTEEEGLPGVRFKRQKTSTSSSNISEVELNRWLENETGMDRLRMMYSMSSDGYFLQEDTQNVQTMFMRTIGIGIFVNVFKAFQVYKQKEPSTLALSGISNPKSNFRGILKDASYNTLRLTVFAGCFLHLSQAIAAYRNQSSVWEYTFSSAVAFGYLGIGKSLKSFALGITGGALIGTLMGFAVCHFLTSNGITQEQRHAARVQQLLQMQGKQVESLSEEDKSE